MGRRLDLKPAKKLRGAARHQRAFDRSMNRLATWFPEVGERFHNVKLLANEKAVSMEHGSEAFRHHVVRRLVDVAASVARNRPKGFGYGRVAALIEWPDLWASEICVFFDPEYAQYFTPEFYRADVNAISSFVEGGDTDLLALAKVELPPGFSAGGCWTTRHGSSGDGTLDQQVWSVMEIETSEGGCHDDL